MWLDFEKLSDVTFGILFQNLMDISRGTIDSTYIRHTVVTLEYYNCFNSAPC